MITDLLSVSKPEVNSSSVTVVVMAISPRMVSFSPPMTVGNAGFTVVVTIRFSTVGSAGTVVVVVVVFVISVRTMCFNSSGC